MTFFTTAIAVVLGAFALVAGLWTWGRGRRFWTRSFARSAGLALPDALAPLIVPRIMRTVRASALGGAVGEALAIGGALLLAGSGLPAIALVLGGFLSGAGVGAAIAAVGTPRPLGAEERRYARGAAVTVRDYLSPLELVGARVVVVLAVLAWPAGVFADIAGMRSGSASSVVVGLLVLLSVLALVLFEVGARRVLGRGQPAGSETELAWDDALRASALRSLVTAPLCLGLWTTILIGGRFLDITGDQPPRSPGWWVGEVLTLASLVALVAVLVIALISRPQHHYLRRLWPAVEQQRRAGRAAR